LPQPMQNNPQTIVISNTLATTFFNLFANIRHRLCLSQVCNKVDINI